MAIHTTERSGSRFYYDDANPAVRYPGVTSINGMLPKKFLQRWNANMAADLAIDSLDFVKQMAERDREGAKKYIAGAAYRYTKQRGDVGTKAHVIFEQMIRDVGGLRAKTPAGRYAKRVHPDMEPYRRAFDEFLTAVNPELVRAEDVAWSDTHRYSGSFDAILRVWFDEAGNVTPDRSGTPRLEMTDWKTSKSTYPEVALQMSAYENADFIIDPEGNREPMPKLDGAMVLHVTAEDWEFLPVETGTLEIDGVEHDVFAYFLHLRRIFEWERVVQRKVLGKPVASSARALVTGTERRAK